MILSVCVCSQKALQLRSDEHIFKFIKSKFALGPTRYVRTLVDTHTLSSIDSHAPALQHSHTPLSWNQVLTRGRAHTHYIVYAQSAPMLTSWVDPAWLCYSLSTSIVAPGALVCVNNRWRGNNSGPPIDQILCVCWAAQPLDSCSGVADNTAHNPAPHNCYFNYSGGSGKCNAYSTLHLCLCLCLCSSLSHSQRLIPSLWLFLVFVPWVQFCVLRYLNSQFNYLSARLFVRQHCRCNAQNVHSKEKHRCML